MLKALSRTSVDLKTTEVISSLLQILNAKKARYNMMRKIGKKLRIMSLTPK